MSHLLRAFHEHPDRPLSPPRPRLASFFLFFTHKSYLSNILLVVAPLNYELHEKEDYVFSHFIFSAWHIAGAQ